MKKSGSSFRYRSQTYWHDGVADHVTRDGRRIKLRRLYTCCPACGIGFRILTTASAIKTRNLRRRCDGCKRQGVLVEYRLPPKTRRKRSAGAAKGNPRPRRPEGASTLGKAPVAAHKPRLGAAPATVALPADQGRPVTPRWLKRPILRRPAEPRTEGGALVDAVHRGAVLMMLAALPGDDGGVAR